MGFFAPSGILNRKGFFGGAPAFRPSDISGLHLWLDADDSSTLFDATSGGSPVTENGSIVKRWEDKSGVGNHATEATNAPTLTTSGKNGRNILNFATGKYLTCSPASKTYTAQTVFVVFKFSTSSSSYGRIFTQSVLNENDYGTINHYIPLLRNISSNAMSAWASSGIRSSVSASNNIWYIGQAKHSGSSLTVKLNTTSGSAYSHTLNKSFSAMRISAAYTANGATDNTFFNSEASEVILYDKSLTDTESTQVQDYLNSKWAIY
jgi:hypothetical protein